MPYLIYVYRIAAAPFNTGFTSRACFEQPVIINIIIERATRSNS